LSRIDFTTLGEKKAAKPALVIPKGVAIGLGSVAVGLANAKTCGNT